LKEVKLTGGVPHQKNTNQRQRTVELSSNYHRFIIET
jgi:hypothetical protein